MKITDSSFNDFLNERILSLPSYLDSSKRMSFSFRDGKENQNIFAYASLKDEAINGKKGCRILDYNNSDALANERFFDRIESIPQMWQDISGDAFNCLWFYTKDISEDKAVEMFQYIEGFAYDEESKAYIKELEAEKNAPE